MTLKPHRAASALREYETAVLVLAVVAGVLIGAGAVLCADTLMSYLLCASHWQDAPSMLLGMAGGLSFYLWGFTEGQPFRCLYAFLHTALGAFFGVMGAKTAAGLGVNDHLQTVAAGCGGGLGPKGLDRITRTGK